jgi:hypothetical protein
VYSLRSGELPMKVRRAFPATSDISGEFRFHPEVRLVVLYAGTPFLLRIHVRLAEFLSFSLYYVPSEFSETLFFYFSSSKSHFLRML